MKADSKIFIAGHGGMVGSAIQRVLEKRGYTHIITAGRTELDLCQQSQVQEFFEAQRPEYVFLAAAKVGGIHANNSYPADFLYINAMIATNIIHSAYLSGVKKLLNLGSSCIYPREAPQPLKEEYLLTSPLEKTNEAYAIAKIMAIKLCHSYNQQYGCNFISAMPCNLYGPNDNFHLENSHLLPALVRKMADAKTAGKDEVVLWGDGTPRRELLFSEDLAEALVFLMENCDKDAVGEFINVGSGLDHSISEIAEIVRSVVGYEGKIKWDSSYPNGTMRKLMDCSKIHQLGWQHSTALNQGVARLLETYQSGKYREK